ncbi:hypothetical protein [Streptomyces sp. NPDC002467]|uniref:hypothetical protein n=1 Tax=Streptomyces sp. NPDC002467 TaxID=3364647 RepID=UPI003681DDBB
MNEPEIAPAVEYRITAPGPVTGGVQGVAFANGHAVARERRGLPLALDWFRAEGYLVEQVEADPAPADDEPTPDPDPDPDPDPAVDDPAPTEEPPDEHDSED